MSTLIEQREILTFDFQSTAEWRRQRATDFPGDRRNVEAAETLDKLAATVAMIPDDVFNAYLELWEDAPEAELQSEFMRQVGFGWDPSDAGAFLQRFIAEVTGTGKLEG